MSPLWMSLLLFSSLAIFANTIADRYWVLRAGEADGRLDHLGRRLGQLLKVGFGQSRLLYERGPGWMHATIFFGFLVVAIRTVTLIGRGFDPDFTLPWFDGRLGQYYALVKDVFAVLVLVAVGYALWRRLVSRPARLHLSWEAVLVLLWIAALMVTDLLGDAAMLRLHPDSPEHGWAVVSTALMPLYGDADAETVRTWWQVMYWAHVVLVLAFLNFLPWGKHFHVLTALPAVFFGRLTPPAYLAPMDFEDSESFGVGKIEDFSWRRIFDMYSCTECGRCNTGCPTYNTGKPLHPRELICDERDYVYALAGPLAEIGKLKASGRTEAAQTAGAALERPSLIGDVNSEETLWGCTTCGYCLAHCPVVIDHVPNIIDQRRYLTMTEARVPTAVQTALRGLETNSNPWNASAAGREDWVGDLPVPRLRDKQRAEYLLFVGCAGSFDDRNSEVLRALCRLLERADVDYAILGTEEGCCGDPTRRIGNEYLFKMQAEQNVATFQKYDVRKVLTACPHCYNMIRNEYPDFGLADVDVVHHSELLAELLAAGKLEAGVGAEVTVAYHDSCYLGRHNDIYAPPREVLAALPGLSQIELPRSGRGGFCCGAGGGRMFMEEDIGQRINHNRIDEVAASGAAEVVTACPFCLTMLGDAIKETERSDRLATRDIAELLLARLEGTEPAS